MNNSKGAITRTVTMKKVKAGIPSMGASASHTPWTLCPLTPVVLSHEGDVALILE